jgi:thioredoxin reductase/Pyruvate/2-oxoacid:ferredoxin oxidoreductase delta subunit
MEPTGMLLYGGMLAAIWATYGARRASVHRRNFAVRAAAERAGLLEPPSRHPSIDPMKCLGCGACVAACPEHQVLGVIRGKAHLIDPTACVGHGACFEACPTDAIRLVFGTPTKGVHVPIVADNLETNVPGVFIAGELGGVGLIANAVEQGRRAVESMRACDAAGEADDLDLVIAGAGPAGLAASLAAIERGLRFVTVEQDTLGGCIAHYPRGKLVMSSPAELPIVGRMPFSRASKEDLLAYWRDVERDVGLEIRYGERVGSVTRRDGGFDVRTSGATYRTRAVLLAIGRRGTPRRLGVPGEVLSKVVYRLDDAEQYTGKTVLVVGGGNSALEAAAGLAELGSVDVTLSHRGRSFTRAREENRLRIERAEAEGRLAVLMESNVTEIREDTVLLRRDGRVHEIANDAVIVCAGGLMPTDLLDRIGIAVDTKYGTA